MLQIQSKGEKIMVEYTTNKDYLSPKQLEAEFRISIVMQNKMRMRRWRDDYNLPYIKVGKVILYKRSEIESWLDERMVNKRPALQIQGEKGEKDEKVEIS